MAHWLLSANPRKWRVRDFLADGHTAVGWRVSQHLDKTGPGDDVAIWLTGPEAGVIAVGTVTGVPKRRDAPNTADGYWVDEPSREAMLLPVTLTKSFLDAPVAKAALASDAGFADNLILRMPGGRNPFPVTGRQWRALLAHLPPR